MFEAALEFQRELAAVAEREWSRLSLDARIAILEEYDARAVSGSLDWAISVEQWKRERGG